MFAILFAWITISFIILTSGDAFLSLYGKLCSEKEDYNLPDRFVLGLSFIIIPLQIWSLWLPANHFFLAVCLVLSALYWCFRRKRLFSQFCLLKKKVCLLPAISKALIFLTILAFALIGMKEVEVFDSLHYHLQNIRWNEEFAVVPGLGNLNHRIGYNSNYFLLSAIFSFRFLFGEGIYSLNLLLLCLCCCWVLYVSGGSGARLSSFFTVGTFILFVMLTYSYLSSTSTDFLPNLLVLYLIAKIILVPDSIKKQKLLLIIVPFFVVTCKLSVAPLCLVSLWCLIRVLRSSKYSGLLFYIITLCLIVIPWLIRNVIISGYIIFLVYQLDFFDFDWKVPAIVAQKEIEYIKLIGKIYLDIVLYYRGMPYRDPHWLNLLTYYTYITAALISSLSLIASFLRRKNIAGIKWIAFSSLSIILVAWHINGSDGRFVPGVLCAIILLSVSMLSDVFNMDVQTPKVFNITASSIITVLVVVLVSIKATGLMATTDKAGHLLSLYRPLSLKKEIESRNTYTPYDIGNGLTIYVCNTDYVYDSYCTVSAPNPGIFTDITCLEARGKTLQDGFRTRKEYKY